MSAIIQNSKFRKILAYLLIGVVAFVLFIAAFPESSYKFYKKGSIPYGVQKYYFLSKDIIICPIPPKTEISYKEYDYLLKSGEISKTEKLVRQPFPYAIGVSIFLILLFIDPLKRNFSNKEAIREQG